MTVTLEPAATHTPDAGVIEEARGRQRRQRALTAAALLVGIVVIALAFAWGGGNGVPHRQGGGRPPSGGRGLARDGGSDATQLISIVGVSLVVPREWFGHTMTLSVGAGNAAWLQATNFPPQGLVNGEARIKAMRPGDLAVTICECNEQIQRSTQRNRVRPLTLAGDVVPTARTPRGHLVLESSALIDGRLLTIDADFGSRSAARRLLPGVNGALGTLRVRQVGHG